MHTHEADDEPVQPLPEDQSEITPPSGDRAPYNSGRPAVAGDTRPAKDVEASSGPRLNSPAPTHRGTVTSDTWINQPKEPERVKFNDTLRAIFLEKLAVHGKKILAAKEVGISYATLRLHEKNDPALAESIMEVLEERSARLAQQIEDEALSGHKSFHYDPKTGEMVKEETKYESGIRLAMLKRHDPGYKEQVDVNVNVRGGVLIVPGRLTREEWEALYSPSMDPENMKDITPDE